MRSHVGESEEERVRRENRNARTRAWNAAHKELVKSYNKRYASKPGVQERKRNQAKERYSTDEAYRRHKAELSRLYFIAHPQTNKQKNDAVRNRFFDTYGGKCNRCGEADRVVLVLDHVKDNGGARRTVGYTTIKECRFATNNYDPESFQILCHNCNHRKEVERRSRIPLDHD